MTKPDRIGSIIGSAPTTIEDIFEAFNMILEDLKPLNPEIQEINAEKTKTGYILKIRLTDEFRKRFTPEDVRKLSEMREKREEKQRIIDEIVGILKGKVDDEIIRTVMKKMEQTNGQNNE